MLEQLQANAEKFKGSQLASHLLSGYPLSGASVKPVEFAEFGYLGHRQIQIKKTTTIHQWRSTNGAHQ